MNICILSFFPEPIPHTFFLLLPNRWLENGLWVGCTANGCESSPSECYSFQAMGGCLVESVEGSKDLVGQEMGGEDIFSINSFEFCFFVGKDVGSFSPCLWYSVIEICPGVPCVEKKLQGVKFFKIFFFDSSLRCRFSKVTSFGFRPPKFFWKTGVFFGRKKFGDSGKPNMSPKNRSFLKKGNDYLPTTIFHLTCVLFREVSLCFPFLKPLIHQAVKHFQTCWVSLSTSRRPAFHVVNA